MGTTIPGLNDVGWSKQRTFPSTTIIGVGDNAQKPIIFTLEENGLED
ncbi:hypothetical protein [Paenibacillus macquariensis]|nr:hypothetical protein [Paenibacillus macquariensis]MEC0093879.1 hypothetical protein [Paenibacillus macquariensis]